MQHSTEDPIEAEHLQLRDLVFLSETEVDLEALEEVCLGQHFDIVTQIVTLTGHEACRVWTGLGVSVAFSTVYPPTSSEYSAILLRIFTNSP